MEQELVYYIRNKILSINGNNGNTTIYQYLMGVR